jgi:hypothetical protein
MSIAGDLTPAYSFIDTIAAGKTPSPMQAVAAMAGVATVVNPLAGAALMAAGALVTGVQSGLEALFQGLGLYSDQPKLLDFTGGIPKGDPIPAGPNDPLWLPWTSFARVWWVPSAAIDTGWTPAVGARKGTMPNNVYGIYSPSSSVAQAVIEWALTVSPLYQQLSTGKAWNLVSGNTTWATGQAVDFAPANPFEAFFFPILKKSLEFWWNGNPFVDPRALFVAAAKAWNDRHASAGNGDITYSPAEGTGSPLSLLLGSGGDSTGSGQRASPVIVYMGARVVTPSRVGAAIASIKPGTLQIATTSPALLSAFPTVVHVPPSNATPQGAVLHVAPDGTTKIAPPIAPAGKPAQVSPMWALGALGALIAGVIVLKGR